MLVTLVASEVAVRAVESRLPEPRRYISGIAQNFVTEMNLLRARGVTSRVTFIGTSMTQRDIDSNRLETLLGWPDTSIHNVSLPGSQTPVLQRWILQEVVPRIHPKVVVWGISSLEFNSGRTEHSIDAYESSRATESGFFGAADRALERIALSKNRDALRDPYLLKSAASGKASRFTQARPLSNRATWQLTYPKRSPQQLLKFQATHRKYVHDVQLHRFKTGPRELRAFETTIKRLRQLGIHVVVVVMPVPSSYLNAHPNGARDYEQWRNAAVATANGAGADVVDHLDRSMADDQFRDAEHLSTVPARDTFTPLIMQRLTSLSWWKSTFPT